MKSHQPEIASSARTVRWLLALTVCLCSLAFSSRAATNTPPNVLLIVADDLGFGDTGAYGASHIPTPNIDRLAHDGLRFTDAHASSATCTPSRYALLTGEYPWRKQGTGILPGDAALLIQPGRANLASLFKQAGYRTGVVGKWHLGLGPEGGPDWNNEIRPGPLEIGFDYCFLMPATADRVPCVYVENHRVAGLDPKDPIRVSYTTPIGDEPTGRDHPELLKMKASHGHDQTIINGIGRIGYMTGGKAARWVDEDRADLFTQKAIRFIESNPAQPFFLYFASHDPHVPRTPHPRFVGKSGCGVRGDAIVEFDWCVGELLETLDRLGLAKQTLVIVTSDNGPVVDDGYQDGAVRDLNDHRPAGSLRGGKYSIFEGGTRIPFLVRWPGRIQPGTSAALLSQVDLLSSFAALTGQKLPPTAGPDSQNMLPALLGQDPVGRQRLVEHARVLALREGLWKYIEPAQGAKFQKTTGTEMGGDPAGQLFNLQADLGETNNLIQRDPTRRQGMAQTLQSIRKPAAGTPAP